MVRNGGVTPAHVGNSERKMARRTKRRKGAPYPIASARPRRLVSVRDAVETVR
jgi:hypothetical protein